ncbi:MAG: DinB family protein [bacterium]
MSARVKWVEKKFDFDFPAADYPKIIGRLREGPDRFAEAVEGLSEEVLRRKPGGVWSIKENVGHMTNVELLFDGRLDDYEAGLSELRPADMSNCRTEKSDYNDLSLELLLGLFRTARLQTLKRLEAYPPEAFGKAAFHRRLGVQKRLVDTMFFFAEHDEHHLATINGLKR